MKQLSREILRQISDEGFRLTNRCDRISKGSEPYFDKAFGNWLPGDPPEYKVSGFEEYIDYCVDKLTEELEISDISYIKENIEELMDGFLLDWDEYEAKAIYEF